MQTILLYLLIMAIVVAAVFAVVWFVFGRGEDLPPLQPGTTLTTLPRSGVAGDDVRALRFAVTLRGYRQSEVDWALARLAGEIDELRQRLAYVHAGPIPQAIADEVTDEWPTATQSTPLTAEPSVAAAEEGGETASPNLIDGAPDPDSGVADGADNTDTSAS
ncbi:DivIVA domain-containing protein [Gordonia sp. ABSL1-1]|uniref:DivIVA domain-containing protein n=1 Tax=Gordonia sp. ABSL1-1 TaxID=3053923 RepID=UPI0025724378|nr:DivIVA domain-containing protein [Gordonia sp. ABSL1-1]MDL9935664.1 DivIVA domain-containing protein [Gordonia sp. ABSL1-1]